MPKIEIALFPDPDSAERAVGRLAECGIEARSAAPAPYPVVEGTGHWRPANALPWLTLAGAIIGGTGAALLQRWASLQLPFIVGGKPVVAWIPFGVIIFELTMLGAGLATFFGMVVLTLLGRRGVPSRIVESLADGVIAVITPANAADSAPMRRPAGPAKSEVT